MWCLTAPGVVHHRICDDKSAETFDALVGEYDGVIVCDKLSTDQSAAEAIEAETARVVSELRAALRRAA